MTILSRSVLLALLCLCVLPLAPVAEASNINQRRAAPVDDAPPPILLSEQDQRDLKRIEDYFNSLKPLAARFLQRATQIDGSKGEVTGNFKLWRPGRVHIQYDAPSRDFIVADGSNIYHWDDEMRQQSQTGINDTLAGFLLKRDLNFSGNDVTVTKVTHPNPTQMEVAIRSAKDPQAGEMTLIMQEVPMQILGWRVLDAQGVTTEVFLSDIKTDQTFRRSEFTFRNPNFGNSRTGR